MRFCTQILLFVVFLSWSWIVDVDGFCRIWGIHSDKDGGYNYSSCLASGGDVSRRLGSNAITDNIKVIQIAIDQFCVVGDISSSTPISATYEGVGDEDPKVKEILEALFKGNLWSYNPYRDLSVNEGPDGLLTQTGAWQKWNNTLPDQFSRNPWFVEVTGIKFRKEKLKNWLHLRVFQNRSVSDSKPKLHDKTSPNNYSLTKVEKDDRSSGRFIYAVLMVTDQDGWPVGDFARQLPCSRSCHLFGDFDNVYSSTDDNAVPCAYTPWVADTHPGMLVFGSKEFNNESKLVGVRELHASWSFTQTTCHFVTELHFQGLVVENENKMNFKSSKLTGNDHLMGWPIRYDIYHPTRYSVGAPDYVDFGYFTEREAFAYELNCHVDLSDDTTLFKGIPPYPTKEYGRNPENIPYQSAHMWHLGSLGKKNGWKRYYGVEFPRRRECRDPIIGGSGGRRPLYSQRKNLGKILTDLKKVPKAPEFFKTNLQIRCPCPALPTDDYLSKLPSKERIYIRKLHASHMAIAFMTLFPLAIFVIRFFKETFNAVFCMQEWWWFMWHAWLLFIALMYMFGAIYALEIIKWKFPGRPIEKSKYFLFHIIMGSITIFFFCVQIVLGFLRPGDVKQRKVTIFVHWFLGLIVFVGAVLTIFSATWIKDSSMSCKAWRLTWAWLVILIILFIAMEINMHLEDKKLKLEPPRTYLPPPTKRLFNKDAPGRAFRCAMLLVLMAFLFICQMLMTNFVWASANGTSCFGKRTINDTSEAGDEDLEEQDYYDNDDTFFFER